MDELVAESEKFVTEKAFEDFHLYSLPRETTLHDGETKQVEFLQFFQALPFPSVQPLSVGLGHAG